MRISEIWPNPASRERNSVILSPSISMRKRQLLRKDTAYLFRKSWDSAIISKNLRRKDTAYLFRKSWDFQISSKLVAKSCCVPVSQKLGLSNNIQKTCTVKILCVSVSQKLWFNAKAKESRIYRSKSTGGLIICRIMHRNAPRN